MSAVVTIELLEIADLARRHTEHTSAHGPFLVARIGPRFFGRKSSLHRHAQTIDLRGDGWTHAFRVEASGTITLEVELFAERDAEGPLSLALLRVDVPYDVEQPGVTDPAFFSDAMTVSARMTIQSTSPPRATAARSDDPAGTPNTYVAPASAPPLFVVDITAMNGLHEPATVEEMPPAAPNGPYLHLKASAPRTANFRAEGGRVHVNRAQDGTWSSFAQHLDLTATVRTVRGALPAGARIKWTLSVPHDEIVEHPQVRREALALMRSPYSDGFVSNAEAGLQGPVWPGNKGKTRPSEVWEELDGHTRSDVQATSVETLVRGQSSRVRLHCPHRNGDRFIVRATLVPASGVEVIDDVTGMISMWHRLCVEYRPLTRSMPLREGIAISNRGWEPACVQLDFLFYPEHDPKDDYASRGRISAMTLEPVPTPFDTSVNLAYSKDSLSDAEMFLLDDEDLLPNVGMPGFFSLVGALMPHPVPQLPPLLPGQVEAMSFEGMADVHVANGNSYVVLRPGTPSVDPQTGDPIKKVRVQWHAERGTWTWLTFQVVSARPEPRFGGRFALLVADHDFFPIYDGANGHMDHLMAGREWRNFQDYFGSHAASRHGAPVRVRLISVPAYTSGESVLIPTDSDHIAGRLVIFTWHTAYRRTDGTAVPGWTADIAMTVLHEFTHSIAAPHKCGNWAYRHDSGGSCAMNYAFHPVHRDGHFVPGSIKVIATALCGAHLSQVRKTLFQDNEVYQRFHWAD